MPDPQGYCEYGGLDNTIIGGEYTESRGVQPGVFRLRTGTEPSLPQKYGTLTLRYGSNVLQFDDCATATHIQRVYQGRYPYTWSVEVYDKRWKWRYPRISGHYNTRRCDGSIDPATSLPLSAMLTKLLVALDEPGATLRDIPNVQPQVDWENAYAAKELEWLLDWAGLVICPQRNGSFLVERLGAGTDLPVRNDDVSPSLSFSQTVMPSKVEVHTAPTVFQSKIVLEAVGLDTDGTIKVIDNLDYKPILGWQTQWYTTFADVSPIYRHLAFQTVWRWYRLKEQAEGTGSAVLDDMKRLKIMEKLAETHADDLGVGRCLDAVVEGIFWPLSDFKANNASDLRYSGSFRVIPELNLIAFEYPVIKWDVNLRYPEAADLKLIVAYRATDATGAYLNEKVEEGVSQSLATTQPRIEKRKYLKRVRQFVAAYGNNSDNEPEVTAEATAYATSIASTYGGGPERDMLYGGLIPLELSGKVAQIRWRWGNDRVATTRASENHEFDVSQQSSQARRRTERLGQMFDHLMES